MNTCPPVAQERTPVGPIPTLVGGDGGPALGTFREFFHTATIPRHFISVLHVTRCLGVLLAQRRVRQRLACTRSRNTCRILY